MITLTCFLEFVPQLLDFELVHKNNDVFDDSHSLNAPHERVEFHFVHDEGRPVLRCDFVFGGSNELHQQGVHADVVNSKLVQAQCYLLELFDAHFRVSN